MKLTNNWYWFAGGLVRAREGAWIETCQWQAPLRPFAFAPARARGLKHGGFAIGDGQVKFAPARARGLKPSTRR